LSGGGGDGKLRANVNVVNAQKVQLLEQKPTKVYGDKKDGREERKKAYANADVMEPRAETDECNTGKSLKKKR